MKPFGSILEFTRERNEELIKAYRALISTLPVINHSEVGRMLADSPSSRFWVSEERACIVIRALLRGDKLPPNMVNSKREMFLEIFRRVLALIEENPKAPVSQLVRSVIYSPADKFYMQPRSVMDIIYKMKNGYYKKAYAGNPRY